MISKAIFFCFLIVVIGCNTSDEKEKVIITRSPEICVDISKYNLEYIEIDSLRIRDKYGLTMSKQHALSLYQLDYRSIPPSDAIDYLFPNIVSNNYYVLENDVVSFIGKGNNVILSSMILSNDNYLNFKNIKINGETSWDFWINTFPESMKLITCEGNSCVGYFSINSENEHLYSKWFFIIREGKLKKVKLILI